jgi:hypothetical protein
MKENPFKGASDLQKIKIENAINESKQQTKYMFKVLPYLFAIVFIVAILFLLIFMKLTIKLSFEISICCAVSCVLVVLFGTEIVEFFDLRKNIKNIKNGNW